MHFKITLVYRTLSNSDEGTSVNHQINDYIDPNFWHPSGEGGYYSGPHERRTSVSFITIISIFHSNTFKPLPFSSLKTLRNQNLFMRVSKIGVLLGGIRVRMRTLLKITTTGMMAKTISPMLIMAHLVVQKHQFKAPYQGVLRSISFETTAINQTYVHRPVPIHHQMSLKIVKA